MQMLKNVGDRVRENEPLLRIEPEAAEGGAEGFCGGNVHAILYVPTQLAAKVRAGDLARVSPSDIKREEYGYIVGRVEWIASYAASSDDMREKLKNDQLVQAFGGAGSGLRGARVSRARRLEHTQRLQVVLRAGARRRPIEPGAPCDASLVVDERRPYTYVIPALRRAHRSLVVHACERGLRRFTTRPSATAAPGQDPDAPADGGRGVRRRGAGHRARLSRPPRPARAAARRVRRLARRQQGRATS